MPPLCRLSEPSGAIAPTNSSRSVIFANFELLALVGRGGMASVYKARELYGPRKNWIVAIKRLHSELTIDPFYVDLLEAEANLCRYLRHPNIVSVFDAGICQGIHFIVMEYVDGIDLGRLLHRCRNLRIQLPIDFAVFLAKSLLDALDGAHQATRPSGESLGVVHCDVSPSNLFISRMGEIKLGDFGVARSTANTCLGTNKFAGKCHYLSPEIIKGNVTLDADLWATTAVLYELLTQTKPFEGQYFEQIADNIRHFRFRPPREIRPQISPELEAIICRGFSKKTGHRFPSAAQYASALLRQFDDRVGTPLAVAAIVRKLFDTPRPATH